MLRLIQRAFDYLIKREIKKQGVRLEGMWSDKSMLTAMLYQGYSIVYKYSDDSESLYFHEYYNFFVKLDII
jgi:hypothetical protein